MLELSPGSALGAQPAGGPVPSGPWALPISRHFPPASLTRLWATGDSAWGLGTLAPPLRACHLSRNHTRPEGLTESGGCWGTAGISREV